MADFIDTNVWVYAHTSGVDDGKSDAARLVLGNSNEPVISTQVLGEYSAVMIRNRLPGAQVRDNVEEMIAMCRTMNVGIETIQRAWHLRERYGFSYWDCQMIAAALEGGCDRLYTEDLQHGQMVGGLRISNPFL